MRLAVIEDMNEFARLIDIRLPGVPVTIYREVSEFQDLGFDAVLTDLRLQETFGSETIEKLRDKTQSAIIVITGIAKHFLSATDTIPLLNAGADDVFSKDIVMHPQFPLMIADVIARRRAAAG